MSLFEKIGGKSPEPSEEDKAFERRNTLRTGGPEADKIIAENRESALEEGKEKDRERRATFIREWPGKKQQLEKQIQQTEEQLRQYLAHEKELEASRKKNDERQFAMQSRTEGGPRGEQGMALQNLRNLRDMDARNIELIKEEQRKIEARLGSLRGDVESGDRQLEGFQQAV